METLESCEKYVEIDQQGYQKVLYVAFSGASIINIGIFFTPYFSLENYPMKISPQKMPPGRLPPLDNSPNKILPTENTPMQDCP